MYIKESVDERIYELLYERIRIVEDSVGLMEPILGTRLLDLQNDILSGNLTDEDISRQVQELELAVEKSKLEQERFEDARRELMGDDSFLTRPLHAIDQANEFVTPEDAMRLTSLVFRTMTGCMFHREDEGRGWLVLSKELRSQLDMFTRQPGSEGSPLELTPLLKRDNPIPVIFNGAIADRFSGHHFLPPTGFWTRFLLGRLEDKELKSVFHFRNPSLVDDGFLPGRYAVPYYEVKVEGFRTELNLAAVPIDLSTTSTLAMDYGLVSRLLTSGASREVTADVAQFDVNVIVQVARDALEEMLERRMEHLRADHKYRIESRIQSLERGSEVRIERLLDKGRSHEHNAAQHGRDVSQEFLRMIESQVAAETERTSLKVKRLREQQELSFAISLVSVVVIDV